MAPLPTRLTLPIVVHSRDAAEDTYAALREWRPAAGKAQLSANMDNQMSELTGPLLTNPNDTYEISFAGVAPGKYPFHCTPHQAMNMKGTITVTP